MKNTFHPAENNRVIGNENLYTWSFTPLHVKPAKLQYNSIETTFSRALSITR